MKPLPILMAAWLAAASLPLGAAQLYQWKDAQGRTIYSDQPPPPNVKNAQQKSFKASVIEGNEPYASKLAREKYPVTLFATDCGAPCDQARKLLGDRGIPFTAKDPRSGAAVQEELQKLTGKLNVPVLVVGSDKINGFEADRWGAALDRAGYPRTAPVRQSAASTPASSPATKP
jgi:glutaredoxin